MNPEEIRKRIGKNILYLRTHYGISRTSLAKLIHISVRRLRRIEDGDPSAKLYDFHLKRIARVFDVTIESLFEAPFV